MTFTRPKLGAKVYLTRGLSGHTETFDRLTSDRNLLLLLGEARLKVAVEGFLRKMSLDHSFGESWGNVSEYLADFADLDADHLPLDVTVAFWASIVAARDTLKVSSSLIAHAGVN